MNALDVPVGSVAGSVCAGKESLCFWPQYNSIVSYPAIFGSHIFYVVIVVILKLVMRNVEKPFGLKYPMLLYNTIQVGLSVTETVALAPYLLNNFFNINGSFNADIEFWVLVHFCSKGLDFFDTFFMCLRKKDDQISFLHVYHHMTIGVIWGLLLHNGVANGAAFFGAWINSLVHSLMYFHYLWTALGFRNPLKRFLTLFQMLQFSLCIAQVLFFPLEHQIPRHWGWVQFYYHITLMVLFGRFYMKDRNKETTRKSTVAKRD